MTKFLGELLNMGILDSGCTKTVCGRVWLETYRESLPVNIDKSLVLEVSDRTFKFGDGENVQSSGKIKIPIKLVGVNSEVWLETDVIEKELPLLLSRSSMKKANTVISFNENGREHVTMFGHEQRLYVSESGHLCIPFSEFNIEIFDGKDEKMVMFVGEIGELTDKEREKIAKKLHAQFAHPTSERLVKLIKDGGIDDLKFHQLIESVSKKCNICAKYKKPHLKPAVCFPRATEFNEHIAIDLKYFDGKYMFHLIDHFSRYSRGIVINNKEADTIVEGLITAWIAIFGPPGSVLSDNGREFDNEKFKELCEKFNIVVKSTAAESPWSNGINERHNGLIGEMVKKMIEDGHTLKEAVCWSIAAKNCLASISGFSPNQLVFGRNPNFPSILSSKLPALEPCHYKDNMFEKLKAMKEARESFVKLEAEERLKRAIVKKTRTQISEIPYILGTKVYFQRLGHWRGPGIVVGIDNKNVLVKQGGTYYRVPPCSLNKIAEEMQSTDLTATKEVILDPTMNSNTGSSNIAEGNLESNVISDSAEPEEENVVIPSNENERIPQDDEIENGEQESRTQPIQKFDNRTRPKLKDLVDCKIEGDDWKKLRIVSRAGRVGGKNEGWFNVYDAEQDTLEDGQMYSINWDKVQQWSKVSEEMCLSVRNSKDPAVLEAKQLELKNWATYQVYEEVENRGQDYLTVQWVVTQKFVDEERLVKARLVAHGFQETDLIQKDSPTASKESLRVLLITALSMEWRIHSLDVKSAFLQGDQIQRTVFVKPPKEASTICLWRLNKCVYGLKDASRMWYLRLYKVVVSELKMQNIVLDEAVFVWKPGSKLEGIICLHVDDFIWSGTDKFKKLVIEKIIEVFKISRQEEGTFKHLGLQIQQSHRNVKIDQWHYIETIDDSNIVCEGRKRDEPLSPEEKKELKRLVGRLAWAANHTRPDISFDVCERSVGICQSTVSDVFKINKTIRKLKAKNHQLKFVPLQNLAQLQIWAFSDAAHANLKGQASQLGYCIFLVDRQGNANVLKWCSKKIARVIKSSMAAETLALLETADNAFYLKRLTESILCIPDCIEIKCFTDNRSIVDHVSKTTTSLSDFRLKVDMACLRDMLNRREIKSISWVDTKNQLADGLTKYTASCTKLLEVLKCNKIEYNAY